MRILLCTALVIAACAPGEQTRTTTAAGPAQKYVGTWEGRAYRTPPDTGVPFRTVIVLVADGSLRGTLTYPGATTPPVAIRVREYSDTSFVQELGPYHSLVANSDVVTRAVGHATGDSINGTFEMRPPGGDEVITRGTFKAKRASQ